MQSGFEWQETAVASRGLHRVGHDSHVDRAAREPRDGRREAREPREDRREDRRETREAREPRRDDRHDDRREPHHSPIYLDAAAGVPMQRPALAAWLAAAAAPPDPAAAARAATSLAKAMATEGGFDLDSAGANVFASANIASANLFASAPDAPNTLDFRSYSVSWASSVAEANCAIITGAVRRYVAGTRHLPHVVTSAGDPPSVLACCRALQAERACELTILPLTCVGGAGAGGAGAGGGAAGAGAGAACAAGVGGAGAGGGTVDPARVRAALRENTCLVTIAAASADSGVVNDMRAIAAAAHAGARARPAAPGPYERAPAAERRRPPPARIPFHSDVSALIGAGTFSPVALGLDAWTAGFAGVGAPAALAALGVRPAFAAGYGLAPYTPAASALASGALASGAPDASEQCHATALGSASEPSTLAHLGPALAAAVAAWGAPRAAPADVAAARDALAAALAAVPNISFWFESPRLPSVLVVGHPAFGASTVRDLARSAIVGRPSAALVAAFGDFGDSAESRALRNSLRISLAAPITQIEVARVVAEIEHAAGERQK